MRAPGITLVTIIAALLASPPSIGAAPAEPGRIASESIAGTLQLSWTNGVLQSADTLGGTWSDQWPESNPAPFPQSSTSRFFRLRAAEASGLTGRLVTRGHPDHATSFSWTLNNNPIRPEWNSPGSFLAVTHLPGLNRLTAEHPWYSGLTCEFSLLEGTSIALSDLRPEYRGRSFPIGGVSSRFVGHGGGSFLVGYNSYATCADARSKGMWLLELDTLISGDDIPFLSHDWTAVKVHTGLDYGATAAELAATGKITLLEEVLADFDGLILDLIHNTDEDALRIVNYMEAHHPDRIRRDVYLQVYRRPVYQYIRELDRSLRLSFNLASWSAWGITNDWKSLIADIVAETDFYVINPSTMVSADMVSFLNSNGLTNTFVPVMHTHSPLEIDRLQKLAPAQMSPMIKTPDLLPLLWPPSTNCLPVHPVFHFAFNQSNPFENHGDVMEVGFDPPENISQTADASGAPNQAIQLQGQPASRLDLSTNSLFRLNQAAGRESTFSVMAKASRFNTPQVIAMGIQPGSARYVYGFYLYQGSAYFILTHADNTQTWVLAGSMTDRKWHHLTATVSRHQITTYQYGIIVSAARPALPAIPRTMHSFHIGRDPLIAERAFDGIVDEILFYPYPLNQDQVWSLFRNGLNDCPPYALADWPLNEPLAAPFPLHYVPSHPSLTLEIELESRWDADRHGTPAASLRTTPGTPSGAFLAEPGVERLNSLVGSSWTLTGWINLARTTGTQFLLGGQNRLRGHRYHLALVSYDGAARFFLRPALGEQIVAAAGALTAGRWQHLAVSCDGNTLKTYLNGASVATVPLGENLLLLDQFTDFSIGFDPADSSRTAEGLFDEIRIHPFALTQDEISAAAASISAGN
jgi:glycerophosphoryl diester phosphodiesterase